MGEVSCARFRPAGVCLALAVGLTAWAEPAAAIPLPTTTTCSVWGPAPDTRAFLAEVPVEGYVALPLELGLGEGPLDSRDTEPVVTAEVLDADGTSWPGYLGYANVNASFDPALDLPVMSWTSSRPFTPGAHYQLLVNVQNPPDCSSQLGDIPASYAFVVAERPLAERLNDEVGDAVVGFDWVRSEFPAQCCVARNTEHCSDPEHCFACMKSSVTANVIVARTPTAVSAYVYRYAEVYDPDGELVAGWPLGATDAERRIPVPACLPEYCIEVTATSPFTDESTTIVSTCLEGTEPRIVPAPDGAELVQGDPCADGSGAGTFRRSSPPDCHQYPDVRWFSSEVDGLVALGVSQSAAEGEARSHGTGAIGGTGAAGGTGTSTGSGGTGGARAWEGDSGGDVNNARPDDPNCAITTPHSQHQDGSALGWFLGVLVAWRRRGRRLL